MEEIILNNTENKPTERLVSIISKNKQYIPFGNSSGYYKPGIRKSIFNGGYFECPFCKWKFLDVRALVNHQCKQKEEG